MGHTTVIQHAIPTAGAPPIKQSLRRIPHVLRLIVNDQLEIMLKTDVIQPSSSPWSSPIVLVKKKGGKHLFCVDYRQLNARTIMDSCPLPRIDETLDSLSGAKYFSTLDLASGYGQVAVNPGDRPKTAFSTARGLYEFKSMPFGLANAPSTFQRLMEAVLAGLQWEHCFTYLDDIIVFSASFSQHLQRLRTGFERLQQAGLKLKPVKCHFARRSVRYLGHVFSSRGVHTDPDKTRAIVEFPIPTNATELNRFLG